MINRYKFCIDMQIFLTPWIKITAFYFRVKTHPGLNDSTQGLSRAHEGLVNLAP